MTVTYRDSTPADAAAIDRTFRTTFCDTFEHLYGPEDLAAFLAQFTLTTWQSELANPDFAFHVAEENGAIVGYAKLGPFKLPIETSGPAMLLSQLYVMSSHQGAGIAQALMDWTLVEAKRRGMAELYLTVFTENHRARRFYERYGFEAVGRYDFMVGSHADEDIIMLKAL